MYGCGYILRFGTGRGWWLVVGWIRCGGGIYYTSILGDITINAGLTWMMVGTDGPWLCPPRGEYACNLDEREYLHVLVEVNLEMN